MTNFDHLSYVRHSSSLAMTAVSKSIAIIAALAGAVASLPPTAYAQDRAAEPFLPGVFSPDGKMTLTPGFSPDGNSIYFAQTECLPIWECPQRLKRIRRTEAGWSDPELVPLPEDARVDYPSVSPDGARLLFSWAPERLDLGLRPGDENFDLYELDLTRANAVPVRINGPDLNRLRTGRVRSLRFVNNETAPHLTRDGDLYFWSERLDAVGDRDVFVAQADGNGGYLSPVPLGPPINSVGREDGAWISPEGDLMLLTLTKPGGCGRSDLYVSRQVDGAWTEPENLGCTINSPYDEYGAARMPDTGAIVFPSDRPTPDTAPGTVQLFSAPFPD